MRRGGRKTVSRSGVSPPSTVRNAFPRTGRFPARSPAPRRGPRKTGAGCIIRKKAPAPACLFQGGRSRVSSCVKSRRIIRPDRTSPPENNGASLCGIRLRGGRRAAVRPRVIRPHDAADPAAGQEEAQRGRKAVAKSAGMRYNKSTEGKSKVRFDRAVSPEKIRRLP